MVEKMPTAKPTFNVLVIAVRKDFIAKIRLKISIVRPVSLP